MVDWRSSITTWDFPVNLYLILVYFINIYALRRRNANRCNAILVQITIEIHQGLIFKESVWICDGHAILVYALASPETEGDPKLFLDVSLVEWKIHFVDGSGVLWCKYLHGRDQLFVNDFIGTFRLFGFGLHVSGGVDHIVEVAHMVKLSCLNLGDFVFCNQSICDELDTITLPHQEINVAANSVRRLKLNV